MTFQTPGALRAETQQALARIARPALLLFTLGPVQDFIAAARRTSDLRAGSYLLSFVTAHALRPVWQAGGTGAVLFPDLEVEKGVVDFWEGRTSRLPADLALPNRFLAFVPAEKAEALARDAEGAARQALKNAVEQVKQVFGSRLFGWNEADHFLEIAWAAAPYDAARPYGEQYVAVEQAVGGAKALRAFEAAPSTGFRDSLTPMQGALVPHEHATQRAVNAFWSNSEARGRLRLRGGEQLSALSITKRLFREVREQRAEDGFPSTASLATADFKCGVLRALTDADLQDALDAFLSAVAAAQQALGENYIREEPLPLLKRLAASPAAQTFAALPGDWLFADTFTPEGFGRAFGLDVRPDAALLATARQRLQSLTRLAAVLGVAAPSRYYAVIQFDGDRMGTWLSGEHAAIDKGAMDAATHRAISQALATFARGLVPFLVEKQFLGKLVYSGGDDVLCFVSFDDALPLLAALRAAFSGHVVWEGERYRVDWSPPASPDVTLPPDARSGWPAGVPTRVLGPQATASAGLYLAHQQEPLADVLDAARKAEKAAKSSGRNRACLSVGRRSGGGVMAPLPWPTGPDAAPADLTAPLGALEKAIRENHLSAGFLYDARATVGALPPEAVAPELRRLFGRRVERVPRQAGESADQAATRLWNATLAPLLDATRHPDTHMYQPGKALDLVQVAVVFGKGGDRDR